MILSACLLASCCSQEGTADPFSGCTDVAENSCTIFKPQCFHPGCRGLKIYSDLSVAGDLRVPVIPGTFLTLAKPLLGITCPVVLVFLVMYTTDAVMFEGCLLVGIEMEFGTFQGRQFLLVKGQAMMGENAAEIMGIYF